MSVTRPLRNDEHAATDGSPAVLDVRGLCVDMVMGQGSVGILSDIDLTLYPGSITGMVGESGAGKSMTGSAIIGLLEPPLRRSRGEISLNGRRIDTLSPAEMRRVRGAEIGMIFQDPLTALNPVFTIGHQLIETIREHTSLSPVAARERAVTLLGEVGIPAAAERLNSYPHEFSGGMRQRVVIALALAGEPQLVIADEPTTALDVSIQAQIIALLRQIAARHGVSVLLITHDMGVIAEATDNVAVLYAGNLAEVGPTADTLLSPRHPYTQGLIASIPEIGARRDRLTQIPGAVPGLDKRPPGCAFHPRCPHAMDICREKRPPAAKVKNSRVACWLEVSS